MKKLATFIGLFLVLFFIKCDKLDEALTFYVEQTTTTTIEKVFSIPGLPIDIPIPTIPTNSTNDFENHNTKAELVKDVKLNELTLTITNPTDKTFSFLGSIHIYISTNSEDEIELAWKDNISSVAQSISLELTDEKLDKYLKSSTYSLRTEAGIKEILLQDVDLDVFLKFKVTADPL
ncbi:MAG: hypothetical protein U9R42_02345 [Bacteroidota bacterium]|nr:hypothetical protein [Bacteroidota bacterium]